jgi:hypothetical protein
LSPGNWYIGAINISGAPVTYIFKATEFTSTGRPILITDMGVFGSGTNQSFCITWTSIPGINYTVQGVPDLMAPWTTISPTITATDFLTTYCVPLPSQYHFFRVAEGLAVSPFIPPPFVTASYTGSGILLQWNGPTSARYQVQWTSAVSPPPVVWNSFTNIVTSTTGLFQFLDDGSQTSGLSTPRYYRVGLLP